MTYSLKEKLGAVVRDLPQFVWSMRPSSHHPWIYVRNRDERLTPDDAGRGTECDWQWTSDLHIARVFPSLGRALMKRALGDWPIGFRSEPVHPAEKPELSFIIGHRGIERLHHLLLTIQSIAAQREISLECIVVEQSNFSEVSKNVPAWVRYIHAPLPYAEMPYCRAWAFNVGARAARGEVLALHDNDMLVPQDYAREIMERFRDGYKVANLKRFIFYLAQNHSERLLTGMGDISDAPPQSVVQNLEAGGSVAIGREDYFDIGGFDESFIGWGGEDNEFWERAQTLEVWPYGYLPIVHLWHPMQSGKYKQDRSTAKLLELRSAIPLHERIAELAARDFGNPRSSLVVGHPPSVVGQ